VTSDVVPGEQPSEPVKGRGDGFDTVEAVLRAGYFDGMLRRLQAAFPELAQQAVEDALYGAAEKCAHRQESPDNVRAWLYAVARNHLRDLIRRKRAEAYDPEDPVQAGSVPRASAAEDEAFPYETYRTVVKHVESWPVSKMRAVTLLVLSAAHEGEPLANSDLARLAGEALGEEMTTGTAATHKSRGLDRLRREYPTIFPDE
jgi:DNA-directed RNA polymerase specialized sigma24 family protein